MGWGLFIVVYLGDYYVFDNFWIVNLIEVVWFVLVVFGIIGIFLIFFVNFLRC